MEFATTKGAASRARRTFPLGGRWPSAYTGPDEGASVCHVLGGHAGPPLQDGRAGYAVGAAPCGRPQSLPPTGGKVAFAEQMTDEGAQSREAIIPVGTLISQPIG